MKELRLSNGMFAKVDDEDYDWLSKTKWQVYRVKKTDLYYARHEYRENGISKHINMHRYIYEKYNKHCPPLIDHADRDGLNNTKINLRECDWGLNHHNAKKRKEGCLIGVNKAGENRFRARIMKNKKSKHLVYFKTEQEAHEAFKKASLEIYGEYSPFWKRA